MRIPLKQKDYDKMADYCILAARGMLKDITLCKPEECNKCGWNVFEDERRKAKK